MGVYFAEEVEKIAGLRPKLQVRGGRGARGPKGRGSPLGIPQPKGEVGAPQVPSVGVKVKGFSKRTKSAIREAKSKKPGWGNLGNWG